MRTTVVMPEELRRKVRRLAAERGVSMGQLVREALEEKVNNRRPKLRIIGIADSGGADIARRSGEEPAIPEPWR